MKKQPCIFCSIVADNIPYHEIVWQNKNFMAFLDKYPLRLGHTLLIPKKHHDNILDYPENSYRALMREAKKLATTIQSVSHAKRIIFMIEGFSVPHLHVHLIPINKKGQVGELRHANVSAKRAEDFARRMRALPSSS
jgi:histidine triad (HIT) family protein